MLLYLQYVEDTSKSNVGGLKRRKSRYKKVIQHSNKETQHNAQ